MRSDRKMIIWRSYNVILLLRVHENLMLVKFVWQVIKYWYFNFLYSCAKILAWILFFRGAMLLYLNGNNNPRDYTRTSTAGSFFDVFFRNSHTRYPVGVRWPKARRTQQFCNRRISIYEVFPISAWQAKMACLRDHQHLLESCLYTPMVTLNCL